MSRQVNARGVAKRGFDRGLAAYHRGDDFGLPRRRRRHGDVRRSGWHGLLIASDRKGMRINIIERTINHVAV
jgi:hypothetical protein